MTHLIKQMVARAISLCVAGPACAMIAGGVIAIDGSHHTTFLTGASFIGGLVRLVLVMAVLFVWTTLVGRMIDRREGFLNMAFVLAWIAWSAGRLGEVYRTSPESGVFIKLAIESLVIWVGVVITAIAMTNPKALSHHGNLDVISRFDLGYLKSVYKEPAALVAMGAGAISALVAAVIFGQTDYAGQSLGVGVAGGVLAGVAGTMVWGSMHSSSSKSRAGSQVTPATPFAPIMIGVMLMGVLAPLIGLIKPGSGDLLGLVMHQDLPGYLVVSPISWAAGAVLGVPVGHSWVEHSMNQAHNDAKQAVSS